MPFVPAAREDTDGGAFGCAFEMLGHGRGGPRTGLRLHPTAASVLIEIEVSTAQQAVIPGYDVARWNGIVAPATTPSWCWWRTRTRCRLCWPIEACRESSSSWSYACCRDA